MNHFISSTSTCVRLRDCESLTCMTFLNFCCDPTDYMYQYVRECMMEYLKEMTSTIFYVFIMLNFMCLLSCQLVYSGTSSDVVSE